MGDIPSFPRFRDIRLDDADEFHAALGPLEPELSEYSFANLFLFRRAHAYRVSRLDGMLAVVARGYGGEVYAFPPLGPQRQTSKPRGPPPC